jgi:hypothetical protein
MSSSGDGGGGAGAHDGQGLDDRLTILAIFEHERHAAADRALVLDDLLAGLAVATAGSDDGAVAELQNAEVQNLDDAPPGSVADDFEAMLRQRCYREAALPLVMLAGPITRSLAGFLG